MRSMTGFGAGEAAFASGKLAVEIRSTNHRFLDLRLRLPDALADLAGFSEAFLRERLARGRFDVTVHLEGSGASTPIVDKERVRAAFQALKEVQGELAPNQEVPLSLLLHVPGVFAPPLARDRDSAKTALNQALTAALAAMDGMRAREGAALAKDLAARLEQVRARAAEIRTRAPERVGAHKKRLVERIARLNLEGELGVDGGRLAQEVALFAERVDIAEELTRLDSHLDQASVLLRANEPMGRRLDFLFQEMIREANTIAAKSPDTVVIHAVVDVKAEIERMREQVQNVE